MYPQPANIMKILLSLLVLPFLYGASFFIGNPPAHDSRDGIYTWDDEETDLVESLVITGSRTTPVVLYDCEYSECGYSELLHNVRFEKDGFRADGGIRSGKFVQRNKQNGILSKDGRFWVKDQVRSDSAAVLTERFLADGKEAKRLYRRSQNIIFLP